MEKSAKKSAVVPWNTREHTADMSEPSSTTAPSWRSGIWFNKSQPNDVFVIDDDGNISSKPMVTLDFPDIEASIPLSAKSGDFGPAEKEVRDAASCGATNYNVEVTLSPGIPPALGVLNEEGTEVVLSNHGVQTMRLLSPEEIEAVKDQREHKDTPSCPQVKEDPSKPGKLIWVVGVSCAGKSTVAQMLAEKNGYVYYEADCITMLCNPFPDLNADNLYHALMNSKPLKGWSKEDVETITQYRMKFASWMMKPEGSIMELAVPMLRMMCREVAGQKRRLGGDFAVAWLLLSRRMRDIAREACPDSVFVTLSMTEECLMKRVAARHPEVVAAGMGMPPPLAKVVSEYEPAGDDEENAYNIVVTEDMTKEDVLNEVLKVTAKF